MDHAEWVRRELRAVTQSLGFRYTPRTEIESRLARVRAGMQKAEMEALLVVEKMDYYISPGQLRRGSSLSRWMEGRFS